MNEVELTEIFEALATVLRGADLGWIVDQVDEQIQSGRQVVKDLRRGFPDEVEFLQVTSRSTSGTLIGTNPYTVREQANLLIGAVRVAFRDCAALEREVGDFIYREVHPQPRDDAPGAPSERATMLSEALRSAPDREGVEETETISVARSHAAAAERVLPLLDELERRLDV